MCRAYIRRTHRQMQTFLTWALLVVQVCNGCDHSNHQGGGQDAHGNKMWLLVWSGYKRCVDVTCHNFKWQVPKSVWDIGVSGN